MNFRIEDVLRESRRRQLTDDWCSEPCARCGHSPKEHSYNGACYGLCAEWVSILPKDKKLDLSDLVNGFQ